MSSARASNARHAAGGTHRFVRSSGLTASHSTTRVRCAAASRAENESSSPAAPRFVLDVLRAARSISFAASSRASRSTPSPPRPSRMTSAAVRPSASVEAASQPVPTAAAARSAAAAPVAPAAAAQCSGVMPPGTPSVPSKDSSSFAASSCVRSHSSALVLFIAAATWTRAYPFTLSEEGEAPPRTSASATSKRSRTTAASHRGVSPSLLTASTLAPCPSKASTVSLPAILAARCSGVSSA